MIEMEERGRRERERVSGARKGVVYCVRFKRTKGKMRFLYEQEKKEDGVERRINRKNGTGGI